MAKKKSKKKIKKSKGIEDLIMPIKRLPLVVTALFYGRPGTGKNTTLGTFPKPLLLVDIGEKGSDSISDVDDIDVININSWNKFEDLYWYLIDNPRKYKTIGIDTVNGLQSVALKEARESEGKDDLHVSKRIWGLTSGMMIKWIMAYRDLSELGINIVMLAHERAIDGDSDDSDNQINPEVSAKVLPSISSALNGSVNVIGNTFIRGEKKKEKTRGRTRSKTSFRYCMRLGPNSVYNTKIRSPKKASTPEFIHDPSYEQIVDIMKGKHNPSKVKKRKIARRKS